MVQIFFVGASIDILDDQGNDALLLAASHGQHRVVVFLATCGSNFNHRNNAGKTVWDFALEQKNAKLMRVNLSEWIECADLVLVPQFADETKHTRCAVGLPAHCSKILKINSNSIDFYIMILSDSPHVF